MLVSNIRPPISRRHSHALRGSTQSSTLYFDAETALGNTDGVRTPAEGYRRLRNPCTGFKMGMEPVFKESPAVSSAGAHKRLSAYLRRTRAKTGIPALMENSFLVDADDCKANVLAHQCGPVRLSRCSQCQPTSLRSSPGSFRRSLLQRFARRE